MHTPGSTGAAGGPDDLQSEGDYDPWKPFNQHMFAFNHDVLDRYAVKPAAEGWAKIVPAAARRGLGLAFNNFDAPRRLLNNLLQARPVGAAREFTRLVVNTTLGVVGFVDVASWLHVEPSEADAGETLATYGVGPGPYLVLPTLPPLTVRDAIGRGIDAVANPIGYFLPFFIYPVSSFASAINERSLNLQLFSEFEASSFDLYSAARNGYLQRRRRMVYRAIAERDQEWAWLLHGRTPRPAEAQPTASPARVEDPR
jgi:phospholipid-binding lipoprotein MlaA